MRKSGLIVSIFIFLTDRLSKYFVFKYLTGKVINVIPSFLSLRYVENRGAAFSIFSNLKEGLWNILLIILPLSVCLVLLYYILKKDLSKSTLIAFSFILGGAAGNIYDRIFYGKVIDFIDVYIGSYHWPTFNVADMFVFLGCLIIVLSFKKD